MSIDIKLSIQLLKDFLEKKLSTIRYKNKGFYNENG